MRIPSSVKVGPHVYRVVLKSPEKMKGDLGLCDFDRQEISLLRGMKRSKAQEILLHEVLHACTYPTLNTEEKHSDEDYVTGMAPILLAVLQGNPKLAEYLCK